MQKDKLIIENNEKLKLDLDKKMRLKELLEN